MLRNSVRTNARSITTCARACVRVYTLFYMYYVHVPVFHRPCADSDTWYVHIIFSSTKLAMADRGDSSDEEPTIAEDVIVTKYKMAGDMANRER